MTSNDNPGVARLTDLGWNNFFAQQLEIEEYETTRPALGGDAHRAKGWTPATIKDKN